jgi:hypothetical protein
VSLVLKTEEQSYKLDPRLRYVQHAFLLRNGRTDLGLRNSTLRVRN